MYGSCVSEDHAVRNSRRRNPTGISGRTACGIEAAAGTASAATEAASKGPRGAAATGRVRRSLHTRAETARASGSEAAAETCRTAALSRAIGRRRERANGAASRLDTAADGLEVHQGRAYLSTRPRLRISQRDRRRRLRQPAHAVGAALLRHLRHRLEQRCGQGADRLCGHGVVDHCRQAHRGLDGDNDLAADGDEAVIRLQKITAAAAVRRAQMRTHRRRDERWRLHRWERRRRRSRPLSGQAHRRLKCRRS